MTTLLLILGLIAIVAYFKSLNKDIRAEQLSTLRDSATIGTIATFKLGKEIVKTTYKAGSVAAQSVEANHAQASKDVRDGLDNYIKSHGGTVKQAGVVTGTNIASALYLDDAQKALKEMEDKLKLSVK